MSTKSSKKSHFSKGYGDLEVLQSTMCSKEKQQSKRHGQQQVRTLRFVFVFLFFTLLRVTRHMSQIIGGLVFISGLSSRYLKAIWPAFFLGAFLRSGRPRGPGKAFKNVGGFADLRAIPGPPGAGQTSKMHSQNPARLPSGTRTSLPPG